MSWFRKNADKEEVETAPAISPYEDEPPGPTQWWTNEGVYIGYDTAEAADPAHPLRSDWVLTQDTRHYRQDRHIVTIGPNGSGKTRRLLYPNLHFLKNWSIVAIDPKGELFRNSAIERAKTPGHRVMLIDPFSVVKRSYPELAKRIDCESRGFNPLAALDSRSLRFIDDAKALAIALIKTEDSRDKYWPEAAQALIKGLIMAICIIGGADASLVYLRDFLGATPERLAASIAEFLDQLGPEWPALMASLGEFSTFSAEDREMGGIRRTAKVHTDWLDSPEMRADLRRAPFDFEILKTEPTTVYLVLPPEYLATHGVWLRLMVTSILRPLLRSTAPPPVPVLFMLDEFAQLGRMEIIENNYALMRGFGVKLWPIFQDLNQAKTHYGDRWESFISNAGIVQSFAPQDVMTRKYLSQLADDRMTWHTRASDSGSLSLAKGSTSFQSGGGRSDTHVKEPLMYPYELGQMGQGQSVIFTARGHVRRVYFPDASQIPGVREMLLEADGFPKDV
jgi:type IV secretion system protein VirD4